MSGRPQAGAQAGRLRTGSQCPTPTFSRAAFGSGEPDGYGDAVPNPDARDPRAPAIAIWTLTGALVGLAGGVVFSNVPLLVVMFAVIGLLYGLYTTRPKHTPDED